MKVEIEFDVFMNLFRMVGMCECILMEKRDPMNEIGSLMSDINQKLKTAYHQAKVSIEPKQIERAE